MRSMRRESDVIPQEVQAPWCVCLKWRYREGYRGVYRLSYVSQNSYNIQMKSKCKDFTENANIKGTCLWAEAVNVYCEEKEEQGVDVIPLMLSGARLVCLDKLKFLDRGVI